MGDYLHRMWSMRHFWMMLIRLDLQTRYRRSVLGVGWSLMQPLMMTAVLCTVFHTLFEVDIWFYVPYVFIGLTYWSFINHVVSSGCHSFHSGRSYIGQKPSPMAIYPLRTVLVAGLHLLIAVAAVLPFALWSSGTPFDWPLLSLPFTFALFMVIGWSLAVLLGVAAVHFPDIEHLSPAALQVLFYATPVIYPATALRDRGFNWLIDYNPLAACLELLRQPLVAAAWPSMAALVVATSFAAVLLVTASLVLAKSESKLIFHL